MGKNKKKTFENPQTVSMFNNVNYLSEYCFNIKLLYKHPTVNSEPYSKLASFFALVLFFFSVVIVLPFLLLISSTNEKPI